MAKKKANKIKSLVHFKKAEELYESKGQSAVFAYANKHKIGYEFCKACDTDSPQINKMCLVCGNPTNRRYIVSVCRTSYAFKDIEVMALGEADAMNLAIIEAGNHEFSEKSADYAADGLREK
jgi:hypothetical protein